MAARPMKKREVNDEEFRHILVTERDKLLREMDAEQTVQGRRIDQFTVYDINCGWCDDFAEAVAEKVKGAKAEWMNDHSAYEMIRHCVVVYKKRYYDAECIDGVDDMKLIPCYTNMMAEREQVVLELRRQIEAIGWLGIPVSQRELIRHHIVLSNAARPHDAHAACSYDFRLTETRQLVRVPGTDICKRCLQRCRFGVLGMDTIRRSIKEACSMDSLLRRKRQSRIEAESNGHVLGPFRSSGTAVVAKCRRCGLQFSIAFGLYRLASNLDKLCLGSHGVTPTTKTS